MQLQLIEFGCGGLLLIRISLRVVAYIQTQVQGCRFRIHDRMSCCPSKPGQSVDGLNPPNFHTFMLHGPMPRFQSEGCKVGRDGLQCRCPAGCAAHCGVSRRQSRSISSNRT